MSQVLGNTTGSSSEHDGSTDMELSSGSEAPRSPTPKISKAEQHDPNDQSFSADDPLTTVSTHIKSESGRPSPSSEESREASEVRRESSTPSGMPEGYNEHGIPVFSDSDDGPIRTNGALLDRTPGYPGRGFVVPAGTSLQDRCAKHPNQLWDHNLDLFLGVWGPGQIYEGLPKRIQADLDRRGRDLASRSKFLAARMSKRIKELNKEGRLQEVIDNNRERENVPRMQAEDIEFLRRYLGRGRQQIVQRESENQDADDEELITPTTKRQRATLLQVAPLIVTDNATPEQSRPQSGSQRPVVASPRPQLEDDSLQHTGNLKAQSQLIAGYANMSTPLSRRFFALLAGDDNDQHAVPAAVIDTQVQSSTTEHTAVTPSQTSPRSERPPGNNAGTVRTTTASETTRGQESQQLESQPGRRPRLQISPRGGLNSQGNRNVRSSKSPSSLQLTLTDAREAQPARTSSRAPSLRTSGIENYTLPYTKLRQRRPFQSTGPSRLTIAPSQPALGLLSSLGTAFRPAGQPIPTVDSQPLLRNAVHHPLTADQHHPRVISRLRAQVEEQMNLILGYLHRLVLLELRDFNAIANFDFEDVQRDVLLNWIDMVNYFLAGRQLPPVYVTAIEGQRALSGDATRDATWFAEQMHTALFNRIVDQQARTGLAFQVQNQNDTHAITGNHNRAMGETLAQLLRIVQNWGERLQHQINDRESEIRTDARGWRDYDRAGQRLDLFLHQQRAVLAQVRAGETTDVTIESGLGIGGARPLQRRGDENGSAQGSSAPGGIRDTAVQLD